MMHHLFNPERSVESARLQYITQRTDEMLADPAALVAVVTYLALTHPMRLAGAIDLTVRERAGGLARLIDVLHKGAEDIAQAEWARPPMETKA